MTAGTVTLAEIKHSKDPQTGLEGYAAEGDEYALFGLLGAMPLSLGRGLIEPHFIDMEEHVAEVPGLSAA